MPQSPLFGILYVSAMGSSHIVKMQILPALAVASGFVGKRAAFPVAAWAVGAPFAVSVGMPWVALDASFAANANHRSSHTRKGCQPVVIHRIRQRIIRVAQLHYPKSGPSRSAVSAYRRRSTGFRPE